MTRILRVIPSCQRTHGGPAVAMWASIRELEERGIGSTVASLDVDTPEARAQVDEVRQAATDVHLLGRPGRLRLRWGRPLRQWLDDHVASFDAVIVHGIWTDCLAATRWASRRRDVPYVVFVHGGLDPWFNRRYPLKRAKKQVLWPFFQHLGLRDASAVLFTTAEERDGAAGQFRPARWNGVVVRYGVAAPPPLPTAPADPAYVLFLGRLTAKKRLDLVVDGFADAVPGGDARLVVAGADAGVTRASLAARAAERGVASRVDLVGEVGGDDKWKLLAGATALVLPSEGENYGVAVAEALASGTPVIVSREVALATAVERAAAGWVVGRTVADVGGAIADALGMPAPERAAVAERARNLHRDELSVGAATDDLLRVLGVRAEERRR